MRSRCSGVSALLWVYGDHMLRPRAQVAHAAAVVPRQRPVAGPVAWPVAVLLLTLVLGLSGCGSEADETDGPSEKAVACRKEWKALEEKVDGRDSMTNPSALSARWNSIAATIDYYATSGSAKDCGGTLSGQESAMDALDAFGTKLAAYDMELRLDKVKGDAQAYASAPRPPAPSPSPSPSPTKKGKKPKQKPPPLPPKPSDIATALKILTQQAPLATQQQGPGWQQARVTELGDTTAVTKAVSDLAFLSSESQAYRSCTAALTLISTALSATAG